MRQNDPKEDHEDPESSDQEVVKQRTHRESSTQRKAERTKSRSPRRPKVSLKPKSEAKVEKHVRTAYRLNTTIADNYDRLSDESKAWHESLIRDTPHAPGRWKNVFAKQIITGSFCDSCFKCLKDWKRERS